MITKNQLKEVARKNGINLYYQEKEYLQNILLFLLFNKTQDLVFKGGTCLKLAYNYPRFSEDLDFNSDLSVKKIKMTINNTLKSFNLYGIDHTIKKEEEFKESYTAKIQFNGPTYSRRPDSTNSIQIDVGFRGGTVMNPSWVQVNSQYPDVPIYFILAMQKEEILSEKIRALVMRGKGRDMFDIWVMLNSGVLVDNGLVYRKLHEMKVDIKGLQNFDLCTQKEYERDIGNLLPAAVPYSQVVDDIERKLSDLLE